MHARLTLAFVLLAGITLLACRPGHTINTYAYTVPQDAMHASITDRTMRNAIAKGCEQYGWRMAETSPGVIEATLTVRGKHRVVVAIAYSATHYNIKYRNSTNMEYQIKEDGTAYIHPNYNNWVANLNQAIQSHLDASVLQKL